MRATDLAVPPSRSVMIRGRRYPVLLPTWRDPRMTVAFVITSLHVLGQTKLRFELSIAQILITLFTCGLIEFSVRFLRNREIAWPASALLTGNGIAFLLRVNGTVPGDRWSLNGAWIYITVGALAVSSKYLVRVGQRPLFNPSNVALVAWFLILGTGRINPLDLWWAPMSPTMVLAYGLILVGGVITIVRIKMVRVSLAFWVPFVLGVALVARDGHCMAARWSVDPVCGTHYWRTLAFSPEILIFLFFMITDPRTVPRGRCGRVVYAAMIGVGAAGLAATQTREFGTKVAILGALVLVCALRPLIERFTPAPGDVSDQLRVWLSSHRDGPRPVLGVARVATASMCAITGLLFLASVPAPFGEELRPIDDAAAVVEPVSIPIPMPPVEIDANAVSVLGPIAQSDAEAMATDVLAALSAIDAAREGSDVVSVRAMVSRRFLAELEHGFSTGVARPATPGGYPFDSMLVTVLLDANDPQATPRLAVSGGGRSFPITKASGRWIVDGDNPA